MSYMKKYRCYTFNLMKNGFKITYLKKLPKKVRKETLGENEIWFRTFSDLLWIKICKIDSKIDFGTGLY